MTKPTQYFSKEYLKRCKGMTPEQIIDFIENYRTLVGTEKCQMISLKIEPSLLREFKQKASAKKTPYQTQIKLLMRQWLDS